MKIAHLAAAALAALLPAAALHAADNPEAFKFEGKISREVLENYLERAVTMMELGTDKKFLNDAAYPLKEEDLRFIRDTGAKFIGRAIYRWGGEEALSDPEFLKSAERLFAKIHESDPDIVIQGAAFEAVYPGVGKVKVPAWAFEEMGMPPEDRNFSYEKMLFEDGTFVGHWGRGSVPDITRPETQLWFTYLIGSYVKIGVEAIHLGQVKLMGARDPDLAVWESFIAKMRKFADKNARRGKVIFDAHTPDGGLVKNGKSLLDFNSFPLRIREVETSPMEGELRVGHLDSIYGRSAGCESPDGWKCDSLPYLVEFDNFGISKHPGTADTGDHFIWGYDEISWFYLQTPEARRKWLAYAFDWIKKNDKNGHLQMPGSRVVTLGKGRHLTSRAVAPSAEIPHGMDVEGAIRQIWEAHPVR